MSEQTAQEPTMEEILASIRRIISEDEPAAGAAAPAEAAAPELEPEPAEDVLELTERIEEPRAPIQTVGDIEAYAPPPAPAAAPAAPAWEPPARAAPAPAPVYAAAEDEGLVGAPAAGAAASAFGHLAQSLAMPKEGRTLEDVVRELLKPMLKTWLDQNLPAIVEAKVEAEVDRIARRRVS